MKTYCRGMKIDRATVAAAYEEWACGPAGKKNMWRITAEFGSADALIDEIAAEIAERRLKFRPIHRYEHRDPGNGKKRIIGVQSVKQQVCDYVAVHCLSPLLLARVGYWQVSAVPKKGQLFACKAVKKWAHQCTTFIHMDVRQCYRSMQHGMVMRAIAKRCGSADVLYLCETLLGTYEQGLEIGSYFSMRIAQFVLSDAYHSVEAMAKTRRGARKRLVRHQIWYMDDVYLFGDDKRDLKAAARQLERELAAIGLAVKPWKACRTASEPVDIAAYVVARKGVGVRTGVFIRARRSFKRFPRWPSLRKARRVCSYWGWVVHSDMRGVRNRLAMDATKRDAAHYVSLSERNAA